MLGVDKRQKASKYCCKTSNGACKTSVIFCFDQGKTKTLLEKNKHKTLISFWENIFFLLQHSLTTFPPGLWIFILTWKMEITPPGWHKGSFVLQRLFAKVFYKLLYVTVMFIMIKLIVFAMSKTQVEDLRTSNTHCQATIIQQE